MHSIKAHKLRLLLAAGDGTLFRAYLKLKGTAAGQIEKAE